ncbi:hypothetical protein Pse7367_3017 [Thalassoporum mexicanum PCC 7367]|uniref:hypothetical protein n=1 Tax=Thalassoporum mexicanum TaxID=3457544 RepID=UPI00029FBCA1|nr:hypothetical protein [Pseudanabaena sp. PCC 7367]AFY71267.1 hypothetical protein Pse7367_3017 [Pseudanabaena sp. PCC 7367]
MKRTYLVALVSLLTFGTVGATALPARADKINTQIINQTTTIDGNGNTVFQETEQINVQNDRTNRRGNKPGKPGKRDKYDKNAPNQDNYQEVNQGVDIYGNDNYVEQNATQTNVQNRSDRRNPGRGRKYGHDKKK